MTDAPVEIFAPGPVKDSVQGMATTGTIAGVLNAGSPYGLNIVLAVQNCGLGTFAGDTELPFLLHPTGWEPWGSKPAGMVIGNFAIVGGFGLMAFLCVHFVSKVGGSLLPELFNGLDTMGFMRFPSAPLFVFQFVAQGMCLGGMNLVMQGSNIGAVMLGLVACVVCAAVPIMVFIEVRKGVPSQAIYMIETPAPSLPMRVLIGTGEWVSKYEGNHWVHRWASMVRTFKQRCAWYCVVEFAGTFILAGLLASSPTTLEGCGNVKIASACVFLVQIALEAILWPHVRQRDCVFGFVILSLQAGGTGAAAVVYYKNEKDKHAPDVSAALLLVATIVFMFKVVLDASAELIIFLRRRRNKMQEAAYNKFSGKIDQEDLLETLVMTEIVSNTPQSGSGDLAGSGVMELSPRTGSGSGLFDHTARSEDVGLVSASINNNSGYAVPPTPKSTASVPPSPIPEPSRARRLPGHLQFPGRPGNLSRPTTPKSRFGGDPPRRSVSPHAAFPRQSSVQSSILGDVGELNDYVPSPIMQPLGAGGGGGSGLSGRSPSPTPLLLGGESPPASPASRSAGRGVKARIQQRRLTESTH